MLVPILIVAAVVACAIIGPRTTAQTSTTPLARPILVVQSAPGGVQVYVDDELLGTTSPEGRLKISTLKPGKHTLRVSLGGASYGEGQFSLVAGKSTTKVVVLGAQSIAPSSTATVAFAQKAVPVSDI
jgi:hypothetical protein